MAELPAGATLRLFLAWWPPAGVREALAGHQARWTWPARARRVPPQRLHMTLHFLGSVPRERVPALAEALDVPAEPFAFGVPRPAVWPGGIAVLEWDAPPAAAGLHARLAQALRAQGWPVEARPWRPHVTLARAAAGARWPADPPAPIWSVADGHALVCSRGGEYLTLRAYPGPAMCNAGPAVPARG